MSEELDLKQIVKYSYQRKRTLMTVIIIALLLGMLYTFIIKQPTYKVTAQILIDKADASIEQVVISKDLIKNDMKVEFDKASKLIKITTEMSNQEEALNTTNQYIEKLQTKLQEVYDLKTFQIIEKPEFPQKESNMNYAKDILIALFIGIVIDGVYIMIVLSFRGITNIFEIEENMKIKALGNVNLDNKKNNKQDSYTVKNEKIVNQLKRIQANLMLNKDNKNPQTILLTGTKIREGASYITNNLAIQFAKLYSKILVIDTDIKNKTLTHIMAENGSEGLTELIQINNVENIEKLVQKTKMENISILPVGKVKVGEERFLTETISNVIEELKKKYDVILIDSASINENVLPIRLASIADATIIVSESGKVKQEDIVKAKMEIENVGGKIAGIILNKTI